MWRLWEFLTDLYIECSETYQYYNLPFCTPKEGKEYKPEGLGEVLEGDRLVNTPYSIKVSEQHTFPTPL